MVDQALSDEQRQLLAQLATTEHFTLQTARASTVAETNGRLSIFLGAVSSGVVALAFAGQVSKLGTAFFVFVFVLLPALFFLGIVTFARAVQSSVEDARYAHGLGRIHHLYVELAPALEPYFVLSTHDDLPDMIRRHGGTPGPWQLFLTTAGTVAAIDSIIVGVLVGLACQRAWQPNLVVAVVVGGLASTMSLVLHLLYEARKWRQSEQALRPVFPSKS